jgi:replicative DNA helicase
MNRSKTIRSIKEIAANNLEPVLILIDDSNEEGQTSSGADIVFHFAVKRRLATVYFSLEKKEEDIVSELLTKQNSRYSDNNAGHAAAQQAE